MNKQFYSNTEFTELKNRINKEILRRATYRWNLPLAKPRVGVDQTSPMSVPEGVNSVPVDDKTYSINNPSEGSIVRTRNIIRPKQGENPAIQMFRIHRQHHLILMRHVTFLSAYPVSKISIYSMAMKK